jgi:hypothetical protein
MLDRVEAEDAEVGERADRPSAIARAERVARVGDDRDAAIADHGLQRGVVARLAGVVHGDDRPRLWREPLGHPDGIDEQRPGVDVGEHGDAALVHDDVRRGGERHRRHDHLVARPDADREHGGVQGGGAAADRDGVGCRHDPRERRFELRHHRSAGQPIGSQHARDRRDIVLVYFVTAVRQELGAHRCAAVHGELSPHGHRGHRGYKGHKGRPMGMRL